MSSRRPERPRRTTGADVAREAGVSTATVSYVLNDSATHSIPPATRERVLAAAARLRYAPSGAARTLRTGRSDVVLLLLPPDLRLGTQFGDLVEHLSAAFAEAGLMLVVHPWSRDRRTVSAVWSALHPVAVLAHHLDPDEIREMHDSGVEVVTSLMTPEGVRDTWAQAVQDHICAEQVAALAAAGHRHLGYALPGDERHRAEALVRLDGVARACRLLRLPEPVAATVPTEVEAGAAAVAAWRAAEPAVTGVCAFDDDTAAALLAGLRQLGLRAPEDLAVVGVYDAPAARLSDPPLTTVAVDGRAQAAYIAAAVTARLAGEPGPPVPGPEIAALVPRGTV